MRGIFETFEVDPFFERMSWAFIAGPITVNLTLQPSSRCIRAVQRYSTPVKQRYSFLTGQEIERNRRRRQLSSRWHAMTEGVGEGIARGGMDGGSIGNSGSDIVMEVVGGIEGSKGVEEVERPGWAPKWLPQWVIDLRRHPRLQLVVMLGLYVLHIFFFSTHGWTFKKPIIANEKGLLKSLGYDGVVGAAVGVVALGWRTVMSRNVSKRVAANNGNGETIVEEVDDTPWKVPLPMRKNIPKTVVFLVIAYLASGYGAVIVEQIMFLLAGYGVPLTVATTRAWKVLLGHLMWVFMGIRILRRLKPFFPKKGTWLQWKWKSNWLWWAIGGYYVSAFFFILADITNRMILPSHLFDKETVVTKLINPEDDDPMAMAIGSIGPCVTAPVFEEVLYRGFLLPALSCYFPIWAAVPVSSIVFALHHMNPTGIIPLTMLGLLWAMIYKKSGNLLVTILIHAMWNSRVFLGSFLNLGTFTDFE